MLPRWSITIRLVFSNARFKFMDERAQIHV